MKRIDLLWQNARYQENLIKIKFCEKDRIFCKHDIGHFLDVARITMIFNAKEELFAEEELIYAAALLHDIGRHKQYEDGTPHEQASLPIAEAVLWECGYGEEEIQIITTVIANHRNPAVKNEKSLSGIFYRADKASRSCFACKARQLCDWKEDKKNMVLTQ